MEKVSQLESKIITIFTPCVESFACISSPVDTDEAVFCFEQEMAADLRKDKPGMKGATIRKRVGAAWSEHFLSLSLSCFELSLNALDAYREEEGKRSLTKYAQKETGK